MRIFTYEISRIKQFKLPTPMLFRIIEGKRQKNLRVEWIKE